MLLGYVFVSLSPTDATQLCCIVTTLWLSLTPIGHREMTQISLQWAYRKSKGKHEPAYIPSSLEL